MITELLDAVILEVSCLHSYKLTEIKLGEEVMLIFIDECKYNIGIPIEAEIASITNYKQIPVKKHCSNGAIMFSITLK